MTVAQLVGRTLAEVDAGHVFATAPPTTRLHVRVYMFAAFAVLGAIVVFSVPKLTEK